MVSGCCRSPDRGSTQTRSVVCVWVVPLGSVGLTRSKDGFIKQFFMAEFLNCLIKIAFLLQFGSA